MEPVASGAEASAIEGACPLCAKPGGDGNVCGYCGGARRPGGHRTLRVVAGTAHSRLYEAEDSAGRRVALKELLVPGAPDARDLEAFEREAARLAALEHPQLPRVLGHFREGNGAATRLYVAHEFVAGEALLAQLPSRRLDEAAARDVARQVLPVLDYLHTRRPPVVHHDVKPANLLRCPDGRLVLVDLEAAHDLVQGVAHGTSLTGTFGYRPLEQLGGRADPTADLYALGMTLVHLVSGRSPAELLADSGETGEGEEVACSPAFEDWLARLCAHRRENRFASAADALAALGRLPAGAAPEARPADGRLLHVGFRAERCGVCGHTTSWHACASCGASTRPGGTIIERVLATRLGDGRTYRAREPDGATVVVHEHLLRTDVPDADGRTRGLLAGGVRRRLEAHLARVQALVGLELPGVPRLRRAGVQGPPGDRRLCVVRDWVDGRTLEEIGRTAGEAQLRGAAAALLETLAALAGRDPPRAIGAIRPTSILGTDDGRWVLLDHRLTEVLPPGLRRGADLETARERAWVRGCDAGFDRAPPGRERIGDDLHALALSLLVTALGGGRIESPASVRRLLTQAGGVDAPLRVSREFVRWLLEVLLLARGGAATAAQHARETLAQLPAAPGADARGAVGP